MAARAPSGWSVMPPYKNKSIPTYFASIWIVHPPHQHHPQYDGNAYDAPSDSPGRRACDRTARSYGYFCFSRFQGVSQHRTGDGPWHRLRTYRIWGAGNFGTGLSPKGHRMSYFTVHIWWRHHFLPRHPWMTDTHMIGLTPLVPCGFPRSRPRLGYVSPLRA